MTKRTLPPDIEVAAYGFLSPPPERVWTAKVQRPFRGQWLIAWSSGPAVLRSMLMLNQEQLAMPWPMQPFDVSTETWITRDPWAISAEKSARLFSSVPTDLANIHGSRLQDNVAQLIKNSFGPRLTLPSCPVGSDITLVYNGDLLGLLLVGNQIP